MLLHTYSSKSVVFWVWTLISHGKHQICTSAYMISDPNADTDVHENKMTLLIKHKYTAKVSNKKGNC